MAKIRIDRDFLFEEGLGEVDLGRGVTAVDLDFHNVSLLQAQVELLDLRVGNHTDDRAELLDAVQLVFDILAAVLLVLGRVLGVGLLLALVPVLVAAALEFFRQVLGKDGGERAETIGRFDVTDDTNDDHGRRLDDGNGVDDFALVHESTGTVDAAHDVRHTGLVTAKGRQVGLVVGVILGEGTDATGMVLGTLLGQETQATVTGCFKLAMRPINKPENDQKVRETCLSSNNTRNSVL